ncbi:hypothetical protein LSTR_LSTR002106 [Laodelphax striatellus]|uniref:Uncharacterized protein n=1 Tax=Laodelphax striatellus TaxID=195883 RepID=A0A482XRD2_LAOST|nr:hypothetical protein LSTR_LSTR002106 [Laodelphax striatellus]
MVFVCYWMVKTITNQIRNYLNNPVLMNIDGASIQITDIPFPALTFCSDNQVQPSIVNITNLLNKQNRTDDEYEKLEIGLTLCSDHKLKSKLLALQKDKRMEDLSRRLTLYGAGNCKRVMTRLMWEQRIVPKPCKYLQVTMTPLGICYTFNMLPANQLYTEDYYNDLSMLGGLLSQDYEYFQSDKVWDLESGYVDGDQDEGDFPWRLSNMRFQLLPVTFYLDFNVDDMDPLCITGHTFTVALHNPAEPPTAYSTLTQAVTDRGNYIRIVPKVVTTSEELRSLSPQDRGCYFDDEKKLKYFKIYTIRNCEIECETNITLKQCNCSLLDQPHFHSTPICKPDKVHCYKEGLVQALDSENSENINCNCLPSCTELTYDIEYFNLPDKLVEFGEIDRKFPKNLASFNAVYKTAHIKSVQRVAVVITSDIIALTFCSDNQVHPSIVNINDLLNKQNRTDDEYDKLEIGLTLCSELKLRPTLLLALQRNKTLADLTTRLRMYGAGNCKRIFKAFLWEQEPFEKPCEYFQVTMTPKGICYTFNMLPAKQLYTEDYYKDLLMLGLLLQDYKYFQSENIWDPESGYMAGDRNGFEDGGFPWTLSSMKFQLIPVVLLLNFNADDMDPLCVSSGHTFTVAIHNPAEPPTAYSTIAQAVTDRGNYIRIVPRVVTTSKELQSWSPKDRGCYFNDEKKLKYFKIYTMHNCEIECETNITLKECNCTFFDQPHFHSTPTCKPNEMECFKEGLVQTLDTGNRETNNCNCLPSCTELKYDVEYFNVPDKFMDFGQAAGNIPRNTASFYAMYKTTRIKSVQRVAVVITSDIIDKL